jgi:hypothetical protein
MKCSGLLLFPNSNVHKTREIVEQNNIIKSKANKPQIREPFTIRGHILEEDRALTDLTLKETINEIY